MTGEVDALLAENRHSPRLLRHRIYDALPPLKRCAEAAQLLQEFLQKKVSKGTICGMGAEWRKDISLFGAQVYHTGGCSADLVRKRILYYENVISAYEECIGKAKRLTQRENRYNKVMAMHFAALIDDWAKATNIKVFNDSSNLHVHDHIFTVWSQNKDNPHGGEEGTVFFTGIALRDITKLLIKVRQDREAYRKGSGKHGRSDVNE